MTEPRFRGAPGGWEWPANRPGAQQSTGHSNGSARNGDSVKREPPASAAGPNPQPQRRQRTRHWKPRTCRICLETVLPTYNPPSENLPAFLQSTPSVTYESEDSGRLLRPCNCKGTSKYVHEGCLQAWRHADPAYSQRNYWQCPTCGYKYRLQRLGWGRVISSIAAQVTLTVAILALTVFLLGFFADPIIAFCLDPYGALFPFMGRTYYDVLEDDGSGSGWTQHFAKGLASLGLVSFFKVMFASPWRFFFRSTDIGGGRRGTTGRDRISNVTWILILAGVASFLYAVWKGVRAWSRRTLEKAGERVMDVKGDEDNDDSDDDTTEIKTE
ncbi:hypothetical protein EJ06DRAFT_283642 [Trichodelitschia bisporula]|uniref:RING-CH-type domain-containing protein n=1 Tax=Trichodelitschia bisporula TaxID=703511 RepID=A0A6G1I6B1_9PEZI|nr:hypothetical protein EJ06DRAFT_283642 [Trichodelitschia bisporula]